MSCTIESLDTICSIIVSPSYNRTFKIIANNCQDTFKIQLVDGILEKLAISIYIFSLSLSLSLYLLMHVNCYVHEGRRSIETLRVLNSNFLFV